MSNTVDRLKRAHFKKIENCLVINLIEKSKLEIDTIYLKLLA